MTIKDILTEAVEKKITYAEAKEKLKKLRLPRDDFEQYDILIYKLLGKEEKIIHNKIQYLPNIPNTVYSVILQDAIQKVREEWYTPEICQHLFDTYRISSSLMNYFINEAIHIVRMNSMSQEEFVEIGKMYHNAIKFLEENIKEGKNIKLEVPTPNINAEQAEKIIVKPVDCDDE